MMVDNVAPELRDQLRVVLAPQGTSPVASSPHFIFIICHLLQGTPPGEVSALLLRERSQMIPPHVIRDYQIAYVPPELTRPNLTYRYFAKMQSMPEIEVVSTALRMQVTKVAKLIDEPLRTVEERESYRRDVDLMVKIASESVKLKKELGVIDTPALPVPPTQKVEHTHRLELDPRQAAAAVFALQQIRQLGIKEIIDTDVGPEDKRS